MEKNQKCGGKKQKNLIVGRAGEVRSRMYPYKREKPAPVLGQASVCGVAATCFPAVPRSIIGAAGLNFSVRNGKRWTSAL